MNAAVSKPYLRRALHSLSPAPFQVHFMSTGARGARGHGWLHKYRGGLGGRHLQGRFHKRDTKKLVAINDEVFGMNSGKEKMAYLDIEIGGNANDLKRVTIELASVALPQTCKNFMALCNEEGANGYESSKVFKIEPKMGMCLGDISERNDGRQGSCHPSVADGNGSSATFPHESVVLSHAQKGMVSMLSTGLDKNDSRFMITTVNDAPHLDGKYVAFGRVKEGLDVLENLVTKTYTKKGRPTVEIKVAACGTL